MQNRPGGGYFRLAPEKPHLHVRIKKMRHDDNTDDPREEPMSDSEILDEIGYIIVPALDEAREQGVPEVHIQRPPRTAAFEVRSGATFDTRMK